MTCINCNIHNGTFAAEKDYQKFLTKLIRLVESGVLEKTKNSDKNTFFFEEEYTCKLCYQIWLLSVPDQAFRGGWNAKR